MMAPNAQASREREWLSKVRVVSETQPLLPPKISERVFAEVSNALYEDYWLDLTYRNLVGKRSQARVMPLGLAQQGVRMYLICRFEGYTDERALALHRIEDTQCAGLTFERPKDFSLQKYVDEAHFGMGNGTKIKLTLKVKKYFGMQLLETALSKDQVHVELGDYLEISARVHDSKQLDWWLLSLGDSVLAVNKLTVDE